MWILYSSHQYKHKYVIYILPNFQSVRDTEPPNKNYLRLEKLVARVVVPYLGHRGLYEGQSEPEIASLFAPTGKDTGTDYLKANQLEK